MSLEFFSDGFTYSTGNLNGHAPDSGEDWLWALRHSQFFNVWSANGSQAEYNGAGVICIYGPSVTIAAVVGGIQVTVPDNFMGTDCTVFLRFQDINNNLSCQVTRSTGAILVRQRLGGTYTVLGSTTIGELSKPYTVAFTEGAGLADPSLIGNLHVFIDGTLQLSCSYTDPEILLLNEYAALGRLGTETVIQAYDDFEAGLPWLLSSLTLNQPSTTTEYDPLVAAKLANRSRLDSLLGGRQSTILTSGLGLDDAVPTTRIHLIGRC